MTTPKQFEFNPNSPNAVFQKILTRQDEILERLANQDVVAEKERKEIKALISDVNRECAIRHDGCEVRIGKLEDFVKAHRAQVAVIVTLGSCFVSFLAWFAQKYI